jgi:AraC-like DNA-binding protein
MQELDFTVTRVPIAYYRNYPKGYSLTMKSRSSHGLTLILKGELEMTLPDRKITACAGDILLQRSGDAYGLYCPSDSGVEYVVISYQVDCEEALLSLLPDRFFATEHLNRYRHAFENVTRVFSSFGVCHKPLLRALVQEILCNIIRDNYPNILSFEKNPVEHAKQYMGQYFNRDLTADHIASVVGVSPSHLRALFQKSEGISPIRYLNRVRVERAKEMLSSGMFALSEVADACGFQNVYYFNRVFKTHVGIPPGKY